MLVVVIIYTFGNLKDCLMKGIPHLIVVLLSHYGTKARVKFNGTCLKKIKLHIIMGQ